MASDSTYNYFLERSISHNTVIATPQNDECYIEARRALQPYKIYYEDEGCIGFDLCFEDLARRKYTERLKFVYSYTEKGYKCLCIDNDIPHEDIDKTESLNI